MTEYSPFQMMAMCLISFRPWRQAKMKGQIYKKMSWAWRMTHSCRILNPRSRIALPTIQRSIKSYKSLQAKTFII